MTTQLDNSVGSLDWATFSRLMTSGSIRWAQGEHVALIGPTGCGKTTLAESLLKLRTAVVVIATKPKSESITRFAKKNYYQIIRDWDKRPPYQQAKKLVLWPTMTRIGDTSNQQLQVYKALARIFTIGKWCVYLDELKYITDTLNLKRVVDLYLLQGRELGISLMVAAQRPAWIPLEVYDMSTHVFLWQERDERNLARMAGLASLDTRLIRQTVTNLEPHEFLYINTRTGYLVRSRAPNPDGEVAQ